MAVGIMDVQIGKYYAFSAPDAAIFSAVDGLVVDKTQYEITLQSDSGDSQKLSIQPWIIAQEVNKANSDQIELQICDIRKQFQSPTLHASTTYVSENEAVDGIEEKRDFEATGYYLRNGFPHKVFNTIPYVLNRDEENPVAFQLLIYSLDYCTSLPMEYPHVYMPYFPNQEMLFCEDNIAVLRRVSRIVRAELVRSNYHEGAELRFTGVITTFTGDHGWINVNDKLSLRFSKDSILDNRLLEILKLGMPVVGWTEVTFTISRTQSGYYACRVRPTELAIAIAKHLDCNIAEQCSLPSNFEDSPICGRNSLPQSLQDQLLYLGNEELFIPRTTKCGEVVFCAEAEEEKSKLFGQIEADGNIYNFHYYQVCDNDVVAAWREQRLIGTKVFFEPAFNYTKNVVSLSADFIRFSSFSLDIPKAEYMDLVWNACLYDRNELESFVQLEGVNKEFVSLQPWLPIYDEFLGNSTVGKINPHASRQKGWIHLTNGFRYGFFYSQIQDELLYVLLNSALREAVDWSKIDVCFTPKKTNGVGIADNVILTMKSRIELSKRFGLEGPVMPLSEKMVFTRRMSFVPVDANLGTFLDLDSTEEMMAEITDYNQVQKRIKLTQKPTTMVEAYTIRLEWIKDSLLAEAIKNNRCKGLSVSYQRKISMDGDYYPYNMRLTAISRAKCEEQTQKIVATPIQAVVQKTEQRITTDVVQPQIKKEFGILLPTKREATIGYIGKEYYTKACGMQQFPSGVASYDKKLLLFETEYQYVYVVSYTYSTQQIGNIKYALNVEYHDKYEYSTLGKLIVRADGSVEATSLLAVTADKYLRRDVSFLLRGGEYIDGIVDTYNNEGFTIVTTDDDNAVVSFDSIEKAYIYGEIRPYFAVNGTGRIDQYFFFHINNMLLSAEAAQITDGVQVKFSLRGVKRDNGLEAAEIQITPDDYIDVFVVGELTTGEYSVVDASDYGTAFDPKEYAVQVKNAPRMLNHEYCDYKVRLKKKRVETKWSWVADADIVRPKLYYGYLTSLENQVAVIKSDAQLKTNHAGVEFKCIDLVRYIERNGINGVVDTNRYYYSIMYTLAKQLDGSMLIHIIKVCGRELKKRFGMLHTFISNGSYGFIVADEDSDVPTEVRKQQNLDYYCTFETMQNPPTSISTRYNRYYVSFVGETMFSGRRKATKVEFIRVTPLETRTRSSVNCNEDNVNPLTAIDDEYETETSIIQLNEGNDNIPADNRMHYGILRAYSPKFEEVRVFDNYMSASTLESAQVRPPIAVAGAGLEFNVDEIKTSKYVYLIRFAIRDESTDPQQNTTWNIDENVQIEVLQSFLRSSTKLLEISEGALKVEKKIPRKLSKKEQPSIHENDGLIIDYQRGESIYIQNIAGTDSFITEYTETDYDGSIVTARGKINPQTQQVFRFGIITDFDEQFSWGIVNHSYRVDLSAMESKAYNMLKTLKKQMVVMYACQNGRITSVIRCDTKIMDLISWNEGRVMRYVETAEEKARYLEIDTNKKLATHYLSTMSDGYVCKRIKQGLLENDHVFIREVSLPVKNGPKIEMAYVVLDIHCMAEENTLIEYDEGSNRFLAVRNPTYKVELDGSDVILREYVGQSVEVVFTKDEKRLTARIGEMGMNDEDDDGAEMLINAPPQNVFETSLARMLERRIDVETYQQKLTPVLFGRIRKSGLKRSEQNWHVALLIKKAYGVNGTFKYGKGKPQSSSSYMIRGISSRLKEIFDDSVQKPDEYFYYANTLAQVYHEESMYALNLYRAFQVDYCSLGELRNFEENMHKNASFGRSDFKSLLAEMLKKDSPKDSLVTHLVQLDDLRSEYFVRQIAPNCHQLTKQIIVWCQSNGMSVESRDVDTLLRNVKEKYRRVKSAVLSDLLALDWLTSIQRGEISAFLKFLCETDMIRLTKFVDECKAVSIIVNKALRADFAASEAGLKEAYREVSALKADIEAHPSLESVDLLYNTGRIDALLDMIQARLNQLYADERNIPHIRVEVNEYSIDYNTTMLLVISNDSESQQTARDITLSLLKYTDDDRIDITGVPVIQGTSQITCTLQPGEKIVYEARIAIDNDFPKGEKIFVGWSVSFKRNASFENGVTSVVTTNADGEINLQLKQAEDRIDKRNAINEYANKHNEALKDSQMFFGRDDEKRKIINFILENDRFVSGRIVILYGQKKCGKSSLIYQIMNELRARGNGQQKALMIYIGEFYADVRNTDPNKFYPELYSMILQYIESATWEDNELDQLLVEKDLLVPDMPGYAEADRPAVFRRYMMRLLREIKDKYQIVLVMDEFTGWCTEIEKKYKTKPEVLNSLLFVKYLSEMGFVQIIIGHANMEQALTSLGAYNKIGQFAKKVNLSALQKDDAKEMILTPMVRQFGFGDQMGPYSTPLGKIALDRILDLSGRSPFVLMRLCDSIFKWYKESPHTQITDMDIRKIVNQELAGNVNWPLAEFNFLLEESGDFQASDEQRPSFKYLKEIALHYDQAIGDCDANVCSREIGFNEDGELRSGAIGTLRDIEKANEQVRDMLVARHVISHEKNRVKIHVGLFREYILRRYVNKG